MWPTLFNLPFIHLPIRSYGFMLMVGFLGGTWWATRRAMRVKADPDFVVNLGFISLIASVVGSRIFYVAHYWDEHFAGRGLWAVVDITRGGLEFYGGFIGAMVGVLVYMKLRKVSIRLYLDILTPSLMFGMAMARIGCFLNGCCWGGPCPASLPWKVQFPYASPALQREWEERMVSLPAELLFINSSGVAMPISRELLDMTPGQLDGPRLAVERAEQDLKNAQTSHADEQTLAGLRKTLERAQKDRRRMAEGTVVLTSQLDRYNMTLPQLKDLAYTQGRTLPLHPVQLYASMNGLLLAILLNQIFYHRKRHGVVFAFLLMLYPVARVMEEMIRIDNPHDTAGLTISQFVSVLLVSCGLLLFYALKKMPMRSPLAVPFVPPAPPPPKKSRKG
jgi:phosphatidylglycerol---prolipoprotein diacylglyceryl transferase